MEIPKTVVVRNSKCSLNRHLAEVLGWCLLLSAILLSTPALAFKKVALVIGNDQYENVPDLNKAINDAKTISDVLKRTGFEVIEAHNLNRRNLNLKIQDFARRIEPGDVAMFYYAGHGVEISGQNYLLPVDVPMAQPGYEEYLQNESISLDNSVLERLRNRHASMNIVVLDACRDNPFKRGNKRGVGSTRGLARVTAPEGTFIMFSAGAGQAALDGLSDTDPNPNSVFTRVLAPMIEKPNVNLPAMAREVRRQVKQLAGTVRHKQTPAYYDEMVGDFYFINVKQQKAGNLPVTTPANPAQPGVIAKDDSMELAYWREVRDSNNIVLLDSYLRHYPEGKFVFLARIKIAALKKTIQETPVVASAPPGASEIPTKTKKPASIVVAGGTDIEGLLQECKAHFNANRLTSGAGGNALACYKEVLDIRRGQPDALTGIKKIEDRYIGWARRELGRKNPKKAQQYLNRLLNVNPENTEISDLQDAITKESKVYTNSRSGIIECKLSGYTTIQATREYCENKRAQIAASKLLEGQRNINSSALKRASDITECKLSGYTTIQATREYCENKRAQIAAANKLLEGQTK